MYFKNFRLLAILFALVTLAACSKDPDVENDTPDEDTIDLRNVKIQQFNFTEHTNLPITIEHPVLSNGTEMQPGKISITLPSDSDLSGLTPVTSNFQQAGFRIEPALGIKTNYSSGSLRYTIRSTQHPSKKVHYDVHLTQAAPSPLNLSSFVFPKNKNPALQHDIIATEIVENPASLNYIYIFVPDGTDLSRLTPGIQHNGSSIYFSQDETLPTDQYSTPYPAGGKEIDFRYPKGFFLSLRRGTAMKTYSVIVDYITPVSVNQANAALPDLKQGINHMVKAGEITNTGNQPIGMTATSYSETIPAGITVIRANARIPAGGLLPGAKADIMASINGINFPVGNYQTTAKFQPNLFRDQSYTGTLQSVTLKISADLIQ